MNKKDNISYYALIYEGGLLSIVKKDFNHLMPGGNKKITHT